jgi:putative peptidoglycan lipid II flippase
MSLARDVTTVGTGTLLSRLLGFFRDVGIAAILGAGVLSDAYFAAFQIPNLFRRLLAEGALNSAFVPMWLRIRGEGKNGVDDVRRFGESVLGTMILALGAIALAGIVFAPIAVRLIAPGFQVSGERFPLAVEYVRLSIPYIGIVGFVAVAGSMLNAGGRVAAVAFGIVMFNLAMLGAVLIVFATSSAASPRAGAILSASVAIGGVGQLAVIAIALLRLNERPRRLRFAVSPQVRRFYAQVIPGVLAGGIPQLKLMAGTIVASSSQAAVSWLYYANRLYELPLGVASIAIASVLGPRIAMNLRGGERMETGDAQSRSFEIALALALPSAVAFAILAEPIAAGLFERGAFGPRDSAAVAAALAAISAGLPGHVLEKVFGAISFAHEDTRTPMFTALAGLATASIGAVLLFPYYGHVGIAAAIGFSGWVGATLLGLILAKRRWLHLDRDANRRIPRIILATLTMTITLWFARHLVATPFAATPSALARVAELALLVTIGLAIYLASIQAFGVARLRDLLSAITNRQ